MNKKAQGISMNVIIIAAIALLVLVILSLVFTGRMGVFTTKSQDCKTLGGQCFSGGCNDPGFPNEYPAYACPNEGEICCLPIET